MAIGFNQISADIRRPGVYTEYDGSQALRGNPPAPRKCLIIGQKLSAGTVAELTLKPITRADQGDTYFGRGSLLAEMIRTFKDANPKTEVHAMAIDDAAGGTAATGKITITGPATAAGTIVLYLAGAYRVQVAVAKNDSATSICAAVVAAINAKTDAPVTAAVNGVNDYECDLTARNKGTLGNYIDVRFNYNDGEELPAGVGATITAMNSGAGDPDVSEIIAALGDASFQRMVSPFIDTTSLTAIEAEMESRWGPDRMLECTVYHGHTGTYSATNTLGDGRNSQFSLIIGGGLSPTAPWIWAADVAAADLLTDDPAVPRLGRRLKRVLPPNSEDRFTGAERELLLGNGVSTYLVGDDGVCRIERLITTYQETGAGVDDRTWMNWERPTTLMDLGYYIRTRWGIKFQGYKLADDGNPIPAGQKIVTPGTLKSDLLAWFLDMQDLGLVQNFDQFKDDVIVERNPNADDRVDVVLPPDLIDQFYVAAIQIQFR